jgi:hypothetical protein
VETIDLLRALQEVEKRAERVSDEHVVATYVDAGSLVNALATRDNGVVFGRRGTGKTHALKYLAETQRTKGNFVVYIDMEQDTGSTEGRYGDPSLSFAERATRLVVDVLGIIHDRLLEDAFAGRTKAQIDLLERALDHFGEVLVVRDVEQELTGAQESLGSDNVGLKLTPNSIGINAESGSSRRESEGVRSKATGSLRHRIHFGAVGDVLRRVLKEHEAERCWIIFDEWSGVPLDLQPYLGEMLRRLFFGIPKVSVRIASIPHRTQWRVPGLTPGDYVGLEIGAELFPLLDLDEFVVFPARSRAEQTERSTTFFTNLLYRHLSQALTGLDLPALDSPEQMLKLLFTQITALQEAIRAAEGVPRDALNIVSRAALRAGDSKISTTHIRDAAAQLYQSTKAAQLNAVPDARALLEVILTDVLAGRKARAFLLAQDDTDHPLVQQLVDDRILHLIKKGYSSNADPGARFDVLEIDYGCYVGLLGTANAPQHLFGDDGTSDETALEALYGETEVPEDDYRAIRRAVLNLPAALKTIRDKNHERQPD